MIDIYNIYCSQILGYISLVLLRRYFQKPLTRRSNAERAIIPSGDVGFLPIIHSQMEYAHLHDWAIYIYIYCIYMGMLCSCAYSSSFFLFASGIYRWDTSLRDLLAKVIIAAVTSFYINGMLQVMNVTRCNQLESRHMESSWYYITLILFIMPKWFLHHMTIILLDDSTLVSTDDTWWYHNMLQILIINWNDCFWYTTIII